MAFYDDIEGKAQKKDDQFEQDAIEVMRSPVGRRFIWKLLLSQGLFALDIPDRRMQAMGLWSWLGQSCLDLRKQMVLENMDG